MNKSVTDGQTNLPKSGRSSKPVKLNKPGNRVKINL